MMRAHGFQKQHQKNTLKKITEADSKYARLEAMGVKELLRNINREDGSVPGAVEKAIPRIEKLVKAIVGRMKNGGRLFYIGAGTSGRLGIDDVTFHRRGILSYVERGST